MIASVMAAFRIPDLKKRIVFLFAMFAVYVVGLHITCSGYQHGSIGQQVPGRTV